MKFEITVPSENRLYILDDIVEAVIDKSGKSPVMYLESSLKKQYVLKFSSEDEFQSGGGFVGQNGIGVFKCASITVYYKLVKDKVYDKIFG